MRIETKWYVGQRRGALPASEEMPLQNQIEAFKKPHHGDFLVETGKGKTEVDYSYITVNTIQTLIVILKQNYASVRVLRA